MTVAMSTLAVALASSAYSGAIDSLIRDFRVSDEVLTLGISLFVLGFAIGETYPIQTHARPHCRCDRAAPLGSS
jgi:hypothetical protein